MTNKKRRIPKEVADIILKIAELSVEDRTVLNELLTPNPEFLRQVQEEIQKRKDSGK